METTPVSGTGLGTGWRGVRVGPDLVSREPPTSSGSVGQGREDPGAQWSSTSRIGPLPGHAKDPQVPTPPTDEKDPRGVDPVRQEGRLAPDVVTGVSVWDPPNRKTVDP